MTLPGDALAGARLDPTQLLDVDVDELAWARALVALGGLEPEAPEPAHADPPQQPGDGRLGHPEQLGDLYAGEAQAPERRDRLDALLARAVVDAPGGGGTVEEADGALEAIAGGPLLGGAHAHLGGRGHLGERPSLVDDSMRQSPTLVQAEGGITVQLHPGPPWD